MSGTTIAILVATAAVALFVVVLYNRLVRLRNAYQNAFSQIDVQLKRRHDLIPNLVATVKGYAAHESETLRAVTEARASAERAREGAASSNASPSSVAELSRAEGALGGALGRFRANFEAYPDLKANTNFLSLQEELATTENRVSYARQAYNDSVEAYNNAAQSVPANFVAGAFRFETASLLEFEDRAAIQTAPTVAF